MKKIQQDYTDNRKQNPKWKKDKVFDLNLVVKPINRDFLKK